MKNLSLLKSNYFTRRGIFDNKRIFENTLQAFDRSIKYRYGIELDVRLLMDGTIICFHDDNLKRMLFDEGKTDKMTYDELCYIARYQIPTLEDSLKDINGAVPVLIDIVDVSKKHQLEIKLASILDNYKGEFAIESFYLRPLKWFYKNRPEFIIGYMIGWKNFMKDVFFSKYDFVNLKIKTFSLRKIKTYKLKDKVVLGWRVLTKEDFESNRLIYDNLVCDNILELDVNS